MLIALALFAACTPPTDGERTIATPPPRPEDQALVSSVPEPLPAGSAIVRACDGASRRSLSTSSGYGSGGGSVGSSSPKTSARPSGRVPASAPAPSPSVAPPSPAPEAVAEAAPSKPAAPVSVPTGGDAGPTPPADNLRGAAADATTGAAGEGSASLGKKRELSNEELLDPGGPTGTTTALEARGGGEAQAPEADREDAARGTNVAAAKRRIQTEPKLDWGATVYLSNDDSMSLASAQRLLWALQNRAAVSASQIRPHEFLNYFSFDTAKFEEGDVFSVAGSAELTDRDTLSLAFAVKGYKPPRRPLDLTFVVDRSGSMAAEGRMEYLKRGLEKMTTNLQSGDRIDLVLFDHEVCTPLEDYVVGRDDPALWTSAVSALAPRGSTNISLGLKEGYRIATARDSDSRNARMMLITDAMMNTGDVNPDTVSEIGRAYDEHGIAFTGVGVGRDFNDALLNKITEKGKGAYVYLGSEAVVDRIFGVGFDSLVENIAHDVHFSVDLPDSLAMERFYGEEASTNKADVQPINYYANSSQLFLQDLKVRGSGPVPSDVVTFTAEWKDPSTSAARTQRWSTTVGDLLAADQHNLRKARALMAWTDMLMVRATGGGSPCDAPYSLWTERVGMTGEDAELSWLDGLTRPLCGDAPAPVRTPAVAGVAYKVKVDSDVPIAEVALACPSGQQREALSGSDTVATFKAAPGTCTLTLQGSVPMTASVSVPVTGGDVRCVVRGGRLACS